MSCMAIANRLRRAVTAVAAAMEPMSTRLSPLDAVALCASVVPCEKDRPVVRIVLVVSHVN
jgi:hypothetical protein